MGFLHKLWDETLAGPAPDAGLGKLRKYNSFSASRTTAAPSMDMSGHPHGGDHPFPITRSITVVRRDAPRMYNVAVGSPSTPSSPASSTPTSPFSRKSLEPYYFGCI